MLVPLALFGVLGLTSVVLTHELAKIAVIANGVRAGRLPRDSIRTAVQLAPALDVA